MKRDSRTSIIPKIILILGTLGVLGIILLFFQSPAELPRLTRKPSTQEKLFAQVIEAALPQVREIWERGDNFIPREGTQCPQEIHFSSGVGRSYYQCQPHLWQCFWSGGLKDKTPSIKVDLFGQTYHVQARRSFPSIPQISSDQRFYQVAKLTASGTGHHVGMVVELEVSELPGRIQPLILTDTCRDVYLPERVYGYGKAIKNQANFNWDNFGRRIFIDKFYVSQQQVNEWRILSGQADKLITEPEFWPHPAFLSLEEQKNYCAFYGKRLLEAKFFDAATMTPVDLSKPIPEMILRPATPWQRDISKTFLGVARINPDYQLTPLDCQLAQVMGCSERFYSTDSASWMGIFFGLGFSPESFRNPIEPKKNLKLSSRYLAASSEWHELGLRSEWTGKKDETERPVAFRCYEEVVP